MKLIRFESLSPNRWRTRISYSLLATHISGKFVKFQCFECICYNVVQQSRRYMRRPLKELHTNYSLFSLDEKSISIPNLKFFGVCVLFGSNTFQIKRLRVFVCALNVQSTTSFEEISSGSAISMKWRRSSHSKCMRRIMNT